MALSMDEQRILEEMERRLADDDPRLAARLASFGYPRLGAVMRNQRTRLLASVLTLLLIGLVAVMVYAMLPFRPGADRAVRPHHSGARPGVTQPQTAAHAGATAGHAGATTGRAGVTARPAARRP